MASWTDIIALVITLAVAAGLVIGVMFVLRSFSQVAQSTKESLKSRGVNLSQHGMSVKTKKRMNREDYMDKTQRGFIKALNNSTFGQHVKSGSTESLSSSKNGSAPSSRHNSVSTKSEDKRQALKNTHASE